MDYSLKELLVALYQQRFVKVFQYIINTTISSNQQWHLPTLLFSHSVVSNSLWPPWTAASQASLSFTISLSLLKLMSIKLMMPSNHLMLCCPFSSGLQSFPHQSIFQWVGSSHQVTKVLEHHISPSNVYSVLISSGVDWFYLLIQGTLKSLLHHHTWKASILQCSAFFTVQLSLSYMTTGKLSYSSGVD